MIYIVCTNICTYLLCGRITMPRGQLLTFMGAHIHVCKYAHMIAGTVCIFSIYIYIYIYIFVFMLRCSHVVGRSPWDHGRGPTVYVPKEAEHALCKTHTHGSRIVSVVWTVCAWLLLLMYWWKLLHSTLAVTAALQAGSLGPRPADLVFKGLV